jgi:hypothetical protein
VSATRSINFAVDGLASFNDLVLRIDGTTYKRSDLSSITFRWDAGTQHSVQALTPVKNSDTPQKTFVFSSWTNGNGLVTASGTFTTPTNDVTVTANYVIATHTVNFQTTGLSNFNNLLLTIDGTPYTYSDLGSTTFSWDYGTTHTVQAVPTVRNSDTPAKGYSFSSWTNGNGLTTVSGTLTMPNSDQIITVNYQQSTVHITFNHNGLSHINSGITVLTIDNQAYDYWQVLNTNFQWDIGSTHSVTVSTPLTTWDTPPSQYALLAGPTETA